MEICRFVGISEKPPATAAKLVNSSLPSGSLNMLRRLNYFRRSEMNPHPVFNISDSMFRALRKIIIKLTRSRDSHAVTMSDARKFQLESYYKEPNIRLHEMVGIDFLPPDRTGES